MRVDGADYSIDPRVIGRFVDVSTNPTRVVARCDDQIVARHDRSWAKHVVVTHPDQVSVVAQLRHGLADERRRAQQSPHAGTSTSTPSRCGHCQTTTHCSASISNPPRQQ